MAKKKTTVKKDAKRKALGRGLDALIPEAPASDEVERAMSRSASAPRRGPQTCGVEEIQPGKFQPRHHFDEDAIDTLSESIRQDGVLQPLLVRSRDGAGGPRFELIAGERRWRAAQRAGLQEVPIILRDVGDKEALALSLVENLQREDLNPLEEAEAYQQLVDEFAYNQEDLSLRVGRERSTISNSLRLLKLRKEFREDLVYGRINAGHARALMTLDELPLQRRARNKIVKKGLSVRESEVLIRRMLSATKKEAVAVTISSDERAVAYKSLEDRLTRALGAKVILNPGKRAGRIEIRYADDADLSRIVNLCEERWIEK